MPPENNPTGDNPNAPEPGTPPATPPKQDPPAPDDSEETITLKKSDYKNIISQRDRNAEALRQNSGQDAFVMQMAVERTITGFLDENKEKFPDLEMSDLMHVDDPDLLEAEATRLQTNISKKVQAKLESVQMQQPPRLTDDEKAAKLEKLKKAPGRGKFGQFLRIKQS